MSRAALFRFLQIAIGVLVAALVVFAIVTRPVQTLQLFWNEPSNDPVTVEG